MRGLILAAVLGASAVAAADDRADADVHARRGVALYSLGKYDDAIVQFEAAYTLFQSDALLFNLAQAHRQLGHCEVALRYYKRFLEGAPSPVLADKAEQVRSLVPKLEVACSTKVERPAGTAPATPAAEQGGDGRGSRDGSERSAAGIGSRDGTGRSVTGNGSRDGTGRSSTVIGSKGGIGRTGGGAGDGTERSAIGAGGGTARSATGIGAGDGTERPAMGVDDGTDDQESGSERVATAGGDGEDGETAVAKGARAERTPVVFATAAAIAGAVIANGTAPIAGVAVTVTTPPPWLRGAEVGVAVGAARMWRPDVDYDAMVVRLAATARYRAVFDWGRITAGGEIGAMYFSSLDSSSGVVPGITRTAQWAPLVRGEVGAEHDVARSLAVRAALAVGACPRSGAMLSPAGELELVLGLRYER